MEDEGPKIIPGREVIIDYNDEAGDRLYAILYKEVSEEWMAGYWVYSFKTKKEALKFIKENGLKYKKEDFYRNIITDTWPKGWK